MNWPLLIWTGLLPLLAIMCTATVAARTTTKTTTLISPNVCRLRDHILPTLDAPPSPTCPTEVVRRLRGAVYLLYDINPPEGFNLRRDVYIRLAVFVRRLAKRAGHALSNVRLVLPPWRRLYHWKTSGLQQESLPWRAFFDVESLRRYAPVLEFDEFLGEMQQLGRPALVDQTFQLLHFEDMFENGGIFRDKFEVEPICPHDKQAPPAGHLLQQPSLQLGQYECLHFQGSAALLERLLRQSLRRIAAAETANSSGAEEPRVFALLNAEVVLHDHWADREFWRARRSMRFADHLAAIALAFRRQHLRGADDDDQEEQVQRPPMWEAERATRRQARGGPFLCVHLRRGDFVYGRERQTPTLKSVAVQLKRHAHTLNLTTIFLATDANAWEVKQLRAALPRLRIVRYACDSFEQKRRIKDGGIAIVDQLVCSHARHFVGTYESTFTYRIYEEREILGFAAASTFNTLCRLTPGDGGPPVGIAPKRGRSREEREALEENGDKADEACLKNANWPIVY